MRLHGWSHGSPKQIQDGGGRHLFVVWCKFAKIVYFVVHFLPLTRKLTEFLEIF